MIRARTSLAYMVVIVAMFCTLFTDVAQAQTHRTSALFAGTAKVDITPKQAIERAGGTAFQVSDASSATETAPSNIHDPIFARVVVLQNKDVSLAIISADLLLFSSKRIIDQAKEQWGVDHVILNATHNHMSMVPRGMAVNWSWTRAQEDPGISLDWPSFSEDPWYAATEEKIIAAIGQAKKNMFPARIASGRQLYDSVYLGTNRRYVNSNGHVTMMWDNPSRIPTKPRDPTIGVIRIDDESGKPRAMMVHYACHAVTMMGDPMITAGFPGAMANYVEEQLGPDCMAMFLQGAEGDIDPYEISLRGGYGHNFVKQSGIALGKAALHVSKELPAPKNGETSITIQEQLVRVPYRRGEKSTQACVMTLIINRDLALVTIPGEPFIQHQLNLTEKSPVANTLMLGLSYCGQGSPFLVYIPTVQAVKEGGYGATEASFVSADTGDRLVQAAVTSLRQLLKP